LLVMRQVTITFNGLGEVADIDALGPITVSRAAYTLRGSALSRNPGGALVLDDADIDLPPNTGIEVSGVREISMQRRADPVVAPDGSRHGRRMVTRVTGTDMRVKVNLAPATDDTDGGTGTVGEDR